MLTQGWSCPYGDSGSRSVPKVGIFSLIQGQLCPQKLVFIAFREVGFSPHYFWTICHWARFVPKTSLDEHLLALFFLLDCKTKLKFFGLLVYFFRSTDRKLGAIVRKCGFFGVKSMDICLWILKDISKSRSFAHNECKKIRSINKKIFDIKSMYAKTGWVSTTDWYRGITALNSMSDFHTKTGWVSIIIWGRGSTAVHSVSDFKRKTG